MAELSVKVHTGMANIIDHLQVIIDGNKLYEKL